MPAFHKFLLKNATGGWRFTRKYIFPSLKLLMMLLLVIYDISESSRRLRVMRALLAGGLHRVNLSGYLGRVDRNDLEPLIHRIRPHLDDDPGSVYFVPLLGGAERAVRILSREGVSGISEDLLEVV